MTKKTPKQKRGKRVPLDDDLRWRRLLKTGVRCASCDDIHTGVFDLGCANPDQWDGGDPEPNGAVDGRDTILTEDFCILEGRDFFVRCVLPLEIIGSGGQVFGYGVWSSLSSKNFALYASTFDDGEQGDLGPWFGWFSNRLQGYPDTLNLKCQVCPRSDRQRPRIQLEPTDHPLAVEQREGITLDRLLEIYAINGHDLR